MDLPADPVEEVDIPPNLSVELCSSAEDLYVSPLKNKTNHGAQVGITSLQVSSDGLSGSSSVESLNMLLEKQRKRQLNHPHHQKYIGEPLRPQETVKETSEIFLKYDPISKRKVLNTYEIIKELGHGQHGKVKLARDLFTKQLVAIKIVDRHEKREQKFFRFRKSGVQTHSDKIKREIAIMKKCHYKHVVKLLEVLDDLKSRKIYLVLEYCAKGEVKWCPGDQMETEARGPPLLSFQRTREILRGVVLGLEYLHFQGVIHRDIKPANLLISDDDTVKISDFGVSLAATGASDEEGLESVDEVELAKTAGTPAFFAPEICLGNEALERFQLKREDLFKGSSISFMIDIWALGVTLYCLIFGMLPFISSYELELFEKIVNDPIKFPSYDEIRTNRVSQVSSEEEYNSAIDLLDRLLHKNPMKRINIAEIKKHPFTCWDFNHISSTEDDYIDSKLREIKEFQTDTQEQFKQISISRHELKNAVLGVGKKMMEPMLKNPTNVQKQKPPENGHGTQYQDDYSDSSYIVSEGSIVSGLGNFDELRTNREYDTQDTLTNGFHDKCNSTPLFKTKYSINNDNDNDNNGNDNDSNDKQSDRNIIKSGHISKSEFERELQSFDDKHDPKSMVDLPINSSFASLDSLYIDNFALSKHGNESDFGYRDPKVPSIHVRPPALGALRNPSYVGRNSRGFPNVLQNSSSQLNFFGAGGQSTRNDRVPARMAPKPQAKSNNRDCTNTRFGHTDGRRQSGLPSDQHTSKGDDTIVVTAGSRELNQAPSRENTRRAEDSHNFKIKKGNFFSSFNGQDEETSASSESSTSDHSYSSCSDGESDGSNAESLPFEFGLESANASVLSMRDVAGFETVRPYMYAHPTNHRTARETVDKVETDKISLDDSSNESDSSDELVLSVGPSGFQRRQGSAQSSNNSSRRSTLPYLYPSRDATVTPKVDNTWNMVNGSAPTILNQASQRTLNATGSEIKSLDVPTHLSQPLSNLSISNVAPSTSDQSRSSGSGFMPFASTPSSSGSLVLPLASVKPTTQASNVGGVSSKVNPQEHIQDSSRDLLKTVLITSASSNRRKSVPCIAIPENAHRERQIKTSQDNVPAEHMHKRVSRTAVRRRHDFGESRSQSISLGALGKKSSK